MKYKAIKTFLHDELGRVEKGQEFEASDVQIYIVLPFVEPVSKKPGKSDADVEAEETATVKKGKAK